MNSRLGGAISRLCILSRRNFSDTFKTSRVFSMSRKSDVTTAEKGWKCFILRLALRILDHGGQQQRGDRTGIQQGGLFCSVLAATPGVLCSSLDHLKALSSQSDVSRWNDQDSKVAPKPYLM